MTEARKENHAFVLRLWRSPEGTGWRGRVQHAASGQTHYFQDMADMLCFVENYLGIVSDGDAQDRSISLK